MNMKNTRLKIAKPDIIKAFDSLSQNIFKRSDIDKILSKNRGIWRLTELTSTNDFVKYMVEKSKLEVVRFAFPSRNILRYAWGKPSMYGLFLSLRPNAYFCQYTAMYLHGLTEQIPKSVFLNAEQSPKPQNAASLDQGRIDNAFKGKPRLSNNKASYEDFSIYILSGKNTDNLGVIEIETPEGEMVPVTNIERTLIDITVRPFYAGGVFEVLKAFRLAHGKVSINKLTATLKKLNYKYPYHQAIGFYLEKTGLYKKSVVNLLRKFEIQYDFYLNYGMKEKDYSEEWRLFFPKGF